MTDRPYDIGESNQRQSNFYQGCNDAESGKPPAKPDNDDYMSGYNFSKRQTVRIR